MFYCTLVYTFIKIIIFLKDGASHFRHAARVRQRRSATATCAPRLHARCPTHAKRLVRTRSPQTLFKSIWFFKFSLFPIFFCSIIVAYIFLRQEFYASLFLCLSLSKEENCIKLLDSIFDFFSVLLVEFLTTHIRKRRAVFDKKV